MGDAENAFPSSKKRAAGREISRDNPGFDDDDATEQLTGTFKKASEEVLASRRIVKVRRHQPASTAPTSTASSNPFAGICLVPPSESCAKIANTTNQFHSTDDKAVQEKIDNPAAEGETEFKGAENAASIDEPNGKDESDKQLKNETDGPAVEVANKDKNVSNEEATKPEEGDLPSGEETKSVKEYNDHKNTATAAAPLSSFQQLSSSQNAFTGLVGTGFSSSMFSFGSTGKDESSPPFGLKNDNPSFPSNNQSSCLQLFGAAASNATKGEGTGLPSMQEVPIETGEENEKAVFASDAVLFEYLDGGWKERGKGELKLNVPTAGLKRARLVMRARGNYRLILNANLYPDLKLTNMDKRGITFACMNIASEAKEELTTVALKFKDASIVEEFRGSIMSHKGEKSAVLMTPENSPKACDD